MMWSKDSRRIDPISRSAKPFLDGSLQRHFTGTGIQHFTGEALKRFRIPLPTLSEQQRLVVILDEAKPLAVVHLGGITRHGRA
jgi:hypothetical protein